MPELTCLELQLVNENNLIYVWSRQSALYPWSCSPQTLFQIDWFIFYYTFIYDIIVSMMTYTPLVRRVSRHMRCVT